MFPYAQKCSTIDDTDLMVKVVEFSKTHHLFQAISALSKHVTAVLSFDCFSKQLTVSSPSQANFQHLN